MNRLASLTLAAALAALAVPVSAAEPETYAFQLEVGQGRCTVNYPRADGTTLSFLYLKNGVVNVSVHRPRWEMVDGQDTDSQAWPATLDMPGVGKSTAKWGGYRDGFVQGVWSAWDENLSGAGSSGELAGMMEQATVYTVWFRGQNLGTFDTRMKGFAINAIRNCVKNQ